MLPPPVSRAGRSLTGHPDPEQGPYLPDQLCKEGPLGSTGGRVEWGCAPGLGRGCPDPSVPGQRSGAVGSVQVDCLARWQRGCHCGPRFTWMFPLSQFPWPSPAGALGTQEPQLQCHVWSQARVSWVDSVDTVASGVGGLGGEKVLSCSKPKAACLRQDSRDAWGRLRSGPSEALFQGRRS